MYFIVFLKVKVGLLLSSTQQQLRVIVTGMIKKSRHCGFDEGEYRNLIKEQIWRCRNKSGMTKSVKLCRNMYLDISGN